MEHVESSMARYLGDEVMNAFEDEDVTEIYVNPQDFLLRFDTHSRGTVCTSTVLSPKRIEQFLRGVNAWEDGNLNEESPKIATALPGEYFGGARLQGFIPRYSEGPSFVIRKHAAQLFPLTSYVENGIMTDVQKERIVRAVKERENIIVAGGTSSGKTTLCNAIILEIAEQTPDHRLLILEDTAELQPASEDYLRLTTTETETLQDALKDALRTRPDRILVGEVRDAAAYDMLDAWRTDHPGGCCTVHASTPEGALHRLDQLAQQKSGTPQKELILEAIDLVIIIGHSPAGRKVRHMAAVESPDTEKTYAPFLTPAT